MIKLVRLDYRLLHGQVVFSWTGHVGAQRIIVVDDDAANDEMKKSALLLSKPAGVRPVGIPDPGGAGRHPEAAGYGH